MNDSSSAPDASIGGVSFFSCSSANVSRLHDVSVANLDVPVVDFEDPDMA